MKYQTPEILYFSLNQDHVNEFWSYIEDNGCKYFKHSIFNRVKCEIEFKNAADLSIFLKQYESNLLALHVIIDYSSIKSPTQVSYIRDMVVEFPEVQFLFDKHYCLTLSSLDFLFPEKKLHNMTVKFPEERANWQEIKNKIETSLFEVNINDNEDDEDPSLLFSRIVNGMDNTFDAANLRYAIKYWKYLDLKVHHCRNFKLVQESRVNNLAICIEEEARQNIFTSYTLYANGFRVFPITTRQELEFINKNKFALPESNYCEKNNEPIAPSGTVIIRDFDLQFEDEDQTSIDKIRGYRLCTKEDMDSSSTFSSNHNLMYYHIGWNDLTKEYEGKENEYWVRLTAGKYPVYFITKGPKNSKVVHPDNEKSVTFTQAGNQEDSKIILPGFEKPVCGLYDPFWALREVKLVYEATRYEESRTDYEIQTSRKDHDHSTPLNIYDLANSMIKRAEKYYSEGMYILSALVSSEALEFLNGFHHRLTVKAYYIHAISENAIAMDIVGGNEEYLAKDTQDRVDRIKEDLDRIFFQYDEKNKRYVLNQIYSTCREFCKEHKHFYSEEIFISAIGHLLEGYSIPRLFKKIFRRNNQKQYKK